MSLKPSEHQDVSTVLHAVRNALSLVAGYTHHLLRTTPTGSTVAGELDVIRRETQRAVQLLQLIPEGGDQRRPVREKAGREPRGSS
jgi:hypothetical protein